MPRTRPAYSREFREGALDLLRSGRSVADVARSLGCSQQSLRARRKQAQLDRGERDDGLTSIEREGLGRLRRENARLRQEREILRKAAAFFARESETR